MQIFSPNQHSVRLDAHTARCLCYNVSTMPTRFFRIGLLALCAAFLAAHLAQPATYAQSDGASRATASSADGKAQVIELRVGDEIEPVMAEYVDGGIEEAAKRHASLVLITMDTPGGLSTSMEDIIQHILDSPVPVVVYISPAGSRGASAGFFILMSADVAAIAPGTHTGAAS